MSTLISRLEGRTFDTFSDILFYLDSAGYDVVDREGYSIGVVDRGKSYCPPVVLNFELQDGGSFKFMKDNLKEASLIKMYEKEIFSRLTESKNSIVLSYRVDVSDSKTLLAQLKNLYNRFSSFEKVLSAARLEIENLPKENYERAVSIWDGAISLIQDKGFDPSPYLLTSEEDAPAEAPEIEDSSEDTPEDEVI